MESIRRCGTSGNREERLDFVRFLLSHGANPNASTSRGITALMIADRVGSREAAELLSAHGAKVFDATDLRSKAALTWIDANL
jgi:ankyrin repeat protein